MDDDMLLDVGFVAVVVIVLVALYARRRLLAQPNTSYGPGLLGLSKDDLGAEEPPVRLAVARASTKPRAVQ